MPYALRRKQDRGLLVQNTNQDRGPLSVGNETRSEEDVVELDGQDGRGSNTIGAGGGDNVVKSEREGETVANQTCSQDSCDAKEIAALDGASSVERAPSGSCSYLDTQRFK